MMAVIMGIVLGILVLAIVVAIERRRDTKRLAEHVADPYKEHPYMKEGIRIAAEELKKRWDIERQRKERRKFAKRKALQKALRT